MADISHLSDVNLKIGDLVMYAAESNNATGGVIYQVAEDVEPLCPKMTMIKRPYSYTVRKKLVDGKPVDDAQWENSFNWSMRRGIDYVDVPMIGKRDYWGYWDKNEKAIAPKDALGHVRIKPLFEFFATNRGKKPRGKGGTVIVYYNDLTSLKKIDILELGKKYIELGILMQDLARKNGMVEKDA